MSGMTQLLASRQVEIVRVPKYKERLKTVTTVFEVKPMFGFRNTSTDLINCRRNILC